MYYHFLDTMKPTKNIVFCMNCQRSKMLFETEKKAENFIKFNSELIKSENGKAPERSYFCVFCNGWHITSMKEVFGLTKNEKLLEEKLKVKTEQTQKKESIKNNGIEQIDKIRTELEIIIAEMDISQRNEYIINYINALNAEINDRLYSDNENNKSELKLLRKKLNVIYLIRKDAGIPKIKDQVKVQSKLEKNYEKQIEEWRIWAESKGYNTKLG